MKRKLVGVIVAVAMLAAGFTVFSEPSAADPNVRRVDDRANLLHAQNEKSLNLHLDSIQRETGIDIRIMMVDGTNGKTLEDFTAAEAQRLNIGRANGQLRGVLMVYDRSTERQRVELGYGLEAYLPDAFIGYLLDEHAPYWFNHQRPALGMFLMVRMMHWRIRDEMLGGTFDAIAIRNNSTRFVSGGAGAAARMFSDTIDAEIRRRDEVLRQSQSQSFQAHFAAQPDPETAYKRYLEWLATDVHDYRVGLLTSQSVALFTSLIVTPAYRDFVLMKRQGETYRIEQRGDLAMLYYTSTPLLSPQFMRRSEDGWKLDIPADVVNSREQVGEKMTWEIRRSGDVYSQTFADMFVKVHGVLRVKGGDNRPLPIDRSGR